VKGNVGMDDEFGMGLRSPRDGATPKGITTPRSIFGGPTTPRSFFTSSTPKSGQQPVTTPRGSNALSAIKE
jgi:hypothetical protein